MQETLGPGSRPPLLVAGYDVGPLLGVGSTGEVWQGRCRTTGRAVALKRLRDVSDPAARERLRREAGLLAGIRAAHVIRLHTVVVSGDDLVLVLDLAAAGSLAALVAARGALGEGEVVTLGVPLARALAEVHGLGAVHGDVTPANVLFTADGRPVLSDLGVARLVGAAEPLHATAGFADPALHDGPAGDVHGLAATCLAALTGCAPYDGSGRRRDVAKGPLADVLYGALHPDPPRRPTAGELASALYDAAPARPVRLSAPRGAPRQRGVGTWDELSAPTHVVRPLWSDVGGAEAPVRRSHRRRPAARSRSPWRRSSAAAFAVLSALAATATGIAWARPDSDPASLPEPAMSSISTPASAGATPDVSAPPDWRAVLTELDRARSRAFARGDVDALTAVYAPGSPAARTDERALRRLTAAGLRAVGVRLRPVSVTLRRATRQEVRLTVVDVLSDHSLRDGEGLVLERKGRGSRTWLVRLVSVAGDWRIAEVTALGATR